MTSRVVPSMVRWAVMKRSKEACLGGRPQDALLLLLLLLSLLLLDPPLPSAAAAAAAAPYALLDEPEDDLRA